MKEKYNKLLGCKVVGKVSMVNVLECWGIKSTTERFVNEDGQQLTRCWRTVKIREGNRVNSYQVMYVVRTKGPRKTDRESLLFKPVIIPAGGLHERKSISD